MKTSQIHKLGQHILSLILLSSCADINPYVFDVATCQFVDASGDRISCTDEKADGRVSVTPDEALKIAEKLDNCKN